MSTRNPSSGETVKVAVVLLVLALVVATGAYFVIAYTAPAQSVPQQFGLSVIGNLIPVLLVAVVSLTLIREIVKQTRRDEAADLQHLVETAVAAALKESSGAGRDTAATDISRSLRDELADSASVHQLHGAATGLGVQGLSRDTRDLIGDILHVMSIALIFPRADSTVFFRTFCHLPRRTSPTLVPVCMWSSQRETEDYDAEIPYAGPGSEHFVIAQAFTGKEVVMRELPAGHTDLYPDHLKRKILPELRGVVAVPICAYEPGIEDEALGTISIDTTRPWSELGLDDVGAMRDVLIWGARAVRRVLVMQGTGR